jgi:hypothetical protein
MSVKPEEATARRCGATRCATEGVPQTDQDSGEGFGNLAHRALWRRSHPACELIGYTGDVRRFTTRDQFASYAGVAPIELSSGGRIVHRLSRRGNRQLNHAIHMVAICQIRQKESEGRIYLEKKVAEGKTKREAIRSLKRHVSNAAYRQLLIDAQR